MRKINDIYMGETIMRKLTITLMLVLCIAGAVFADGYLSDPMSIGVGARALGMGKAYVGMAEDGDAVFMNPAGIARITNPKLSSMYSSLLGDVNYIVIGGAYPYGEKSAIGAGLVSSRVADIPLTDSTGASLGNGGWGNNVIFVSYGTYLSALPGLNLNLGKDVLVGGSLKYFSVGGDGTGVSDAAGTGMDVDLGVLYPVTEYAVLGINAQNILPASAGGKITKSTGQVDGIPATVKVGTKITIMGKEGAAVSPSDSRKLYANIDYDSHLSSSQPGIVHAGVEFWPTSNLALRAGMDDRDPTAGVGVRVSGVEFNYAYHPYSGINENTTHYFSIGYLGEARKRELGITLTEPKDKSVIYDDHVTVKGKVDVKEGDEEAPKGPIGVKLNGVSVAVNADGAFSADIPVENYGKKMVVAEASDTAGNTAHLEARLVRLTSFADVPEGYWAKQPIENNATVGLVQGYPDGNFKPERALTRAELATLLVRAKGIKLTEGSARQIFKDVKPGFWAAKYIEVAQREGLVKGYPDKTFRPNNKINKAEGIAVMVRFDQLKLAEVDSKPYWDVSTNHWAAKYIQAAKDAGMLKFIERNRLQPKEALVRSESVEMLAKTSLAGGKIKDLYTWEKGFKPEMETRPQIKASIY
jgi:hypothetical protein